MQDPLSRYPPMMSAYDLADLLGCSYDTAQHEMQQMPFVVIGGGKKNHMRRIAQEHVRKRYGIPEPQNNLQIVKGRR